MLRSLLYDIEPVDLATLGVAALALAACAVVASAIPAWRATRVNPVSALRAP